MKERTKRAIAAGVVAAMTLTSLAGCAKKEEPFDAAAAAVTVDGQEIPVGLVKFMVHYTQAATESLYSAYYGTGVFNMAIDEAGTTFGSLVRDGSVSEVKQLVLAEQHAEEYGVSLTDDEKTAITEAAAAFIEANEEETLEKMSATQEIVERYLELYTLQNKVEAEMSADVDTEVSDEEAAQRRIQYVYFTAAAEKTEDEEETEALTEAEAAATEAETALAETEEETAALTEEDSAKTQSAEETEAVTEAAEETEVLTEAEETEEETEDPETAEAMAKAFVKAEAVIANVKAGDDFETAVAAVDDSKSVLQMTFGSDDETVYDGLITATEGLTDGTLVETPVETDYGYYVVQVVSELDREATDEKKLEIVDERRSDRITELYTEWEEAVEVTQDDDVIGQIVFDFSLEPVVETESEALTEAESEALTEAESEAAVTEAESEALTEAESETEAETESETATEADTEA